MVDASVLQSVSLYFFLTVPDEKRAHAASLLAVDKINRIKSPDKKPAIIEILHGLRGRARRMRPHHWPFKKNEESWVLPENKVDIQIWRNFAQKADGNEIEAVLFSRVLGFRDDEIAAGLGVSEGTVRYRVGRGLRVLGAIAGG